MMGREKGRRVGPSYCPEKETHRGSWCYRARIAKRMTIAELSEKSGVSVRTIKRIESDDRGGGYRLEYKLKKFFGCL